MQSNLVTFARLQYSHIKYITIVLVNLIKVIYRNLWEDARFFYIILNNNNPVLSEYVEVEKQTIAVNAYHTRYEGTSRAADDLA